MLIKLEKKMKQKEKTRRRFLGPLDPKNEPIHEGFGTKTLKEYCNMQKKHLHAYKMGYTHYTYKGEYHKVEQEYYEEG